MPTLEWIGKDKVISHPLDVPYRALEPRYIYAGNGLKGEKIPGGNMIINGDNLKALRSLMPQYEGWIICLFIDIIIHILIRLNDCIDNFLACRVSYGVSETVATG
jgi:hypothetical protein